jgi:threonine/homoserine/homoserine lactone efflux protein
VTFLLTLTNPMTIISFASVYAALVIGRESSCVNHALTTTLGVFLGSIAWWFILSLVASIFRDKVTARSSIWLNKVSGSILFGFGSLGLIT